MQKHETWIVLKIIIFFIYIISIEFCVLLSLFIKDFFFQAVIPRDSLRLIFPRSCEAWRLCITMNISCMTVCYVYNKLKFEKGKIICWPLTEIVIKLYRAYKSTWNRKWRWYATASAKVWPSTLSRRFTTSLFSANSCLLSSCKVKTSTICKHLI